MSERKNHKSWPEHCAWPEPTEWSFDYDETMIPSELDEDAEDLLEVLEYFDGLRDKGVLDDDYSLNEQEMSDSDDEETDTLPGDPPALASDYWDHGFDYDLWQEDYSTHLNLLKIDLSDSAMDLLCLFRNITEYSFVNENLLRQAFTRRAFAIENGLEGKPGHAGCCEELEFLGDSVIAGVVTREIIRQFTEKNCMNVDAPFECRYDEGEMTRLRQHFVSKEYLAGRARELGLGKYILYGSAEKENDSTLEDMMEAVIGAIAVDSGWNENVLDRAVNELLYIQLDTPDTLLEKSVYEIFNAWHQKHFGRMPVYDVDARIGIGEEESYFSTIRFEVPENEQGIYTSQRLPGEGRTRSLAREDAARAAYRFVVVNKLWCNIKNAGITPDAENCINQLQELYQKGYLPEKPVYHITERENNQWFAVCTAGGTVASGEAGSKVKAKKIAAYQVLVKVCGTRS